MITLTLPQLLDIHRLHQQHFHVNPGFRNPGFLLQIVDSRQLERFGAVQEADLLYRQAALYWHGLARSFVFQAGNASTALHGMLTFLLANGCELEADDDELVEAALLAVSWKLDLDDCEAWIRRHAKPI